MKELAIIADDLSSATDCGVQLAQKGFKTSVLVNIPEAINVRNENVIAVDTNSRSLKGDEAYHLVLKVAQMLKEAGFDHIYKTIDSTLRGNLGAEIDGVMDVFRFDIAVIAPAFPLYGRTTIKGKHYLHGIPLNQTEIASDPNYPVKEENLALLLSMQSRRKSGLVDLETLNQGKDFVTKRLQYLIRTGAEFAIFDAQSEIDLAKIIEILINIKFPVLWVGSTGLSRYLDKAIKDDIRDSTRVKVHKKGPVFIVSGSASEVTRNQIATLTSQQKVIPIEINPLKIVAGEKIMQNEITRCQNKLVDTLISDKNVVLYVNSSRQDINKVKSLGIKNGLTGHDVSHLITYCLGRIAAKVVETCELGGIILTGGDTAKSVCTQLGVTAIELIKEIEPGVPLGLLRELKDLPIITKAGAFGDPNTLLNAVNALRRED